MPMTRRLVSGRDAGEMAYLARNAAKRKEPDLVVAGARSIIVVGLHYRAAEPDPRLERSSAWADFTLRLGRRLPRRAGASAAQLQAWLEKQVGRAQYRSLICRYRTDPRAASWLSQQGSAFRARTHC